MQNRKRLKLIFLILFLTAFIFYIVYEDSPVSSQPESNTLLAVAEVHDGDTVSVMLNNKKEKVRLIGIDAPEIGQRPWGKRAKKYLENILSSSGWRVRLEFDVEQRDKYGRVLAYMWTKDGKMANLLMVENGYAMLFTVPPNVKYTNELRVAQNEARKKELGIWSRKGLKERPSDYRREHERQNLIY
ncbi:MAG: thermonuclease family protein [Nitrospirae bacterium]|jgi:micrococcal nuclease|nr:thermonuclease family protein [Nitrospirota bacterium]